MATEENYEGSANDMVSAMSMSFYASWFKNDVSPHLSKEQKTKLLRKLSDLSLLMQLDSMGDMSLDELPELKPYASTRSFSGPQLYAVFTELFHELYPNSGIKRPYMVLPERPKRPEEAIPDTAEKAENDGLSLNFKYWGMKYNGDGKFDLRLGNLTDAGWYWFGHEDELLGFLIRIANASDIRKEFIKAMEKTIPFDSIKPVLMKYLEDYCGMYEIAGDNSMWYYNQAIAPALRLRGYYPNTGLMHFEPITKLIDTEYAVDTLKEQGYPKEQAEEFVDKALEEVNNNTFAPFQKLYEDAYKGEMHDILSKSHSFDEFFDAVSSGRIRDLWLERVDEFVHDEFEKALAKLTQKPQVVRMRKTHFQRLQMPAAPPLQMQKARMQPHIDYPKELSQMPVPSPAVTAPEAVPTEKPKLPKKKRSLYKYLERKRLRA